MNEPAGGEVATPGAGGAGVLLREAREALGLPVEELAAQLKVTARKIEWLEAEQFDQLPDPVFVRALAQSLCRHLKIDPAPVLALLPQTPGRRLDQIHTGLNAPFRDRPSRILSQDFVSESAPWVWAPALLLLAAALFYFLPTDWFTPAKVSPRVASPAAAASGTGSIAGAADASGAMVGNASTVVDRGGSTVVEPKVQPPAADHSAAVPGILPRSASATPESRAPAPTAGQTAAPTAPTPAPAVSPAAEKPAPPVNGVLQFRTSGESWIEVRDGGGVMLLSRALLPGEAVGLNGAMPMHVTIGNVGVTQVVFRGKPMDLVLFTRENIARFELK